MEVVDSAEHPVQEAAVDMMRPTSRRVLEIGYGLGMAASSIQARSPSGHVIVEAHPDVAVDAILTLRGAAQVWRGFWQDLRPILQQRLFDCIYYDPYPMDGKPFDMTPNGTLHLLKDFLTAGRTMLNRDGRLAAVDVTGVVEEPALADTIRDTGFALAERAEILLPDGRIMCAITLKLI